MTNGNDDAFGHSVGQARYPGLTKREYFAAVAMQGLCADPPLSGAMTFAAVADSAVKYADALIEALNKD